MRIAIVQGTRPEIIKNYPIVKALREVGVPFHVLHTNQHDSNIMCKKIYDNMEYAPDQIMTGPYRLGTAVNWLQDIFRREKISEVIVNGDTAASLAGALAAMYSGIELAHVEAGLRSYDKFMYEERNRIMVDAVATSLFAYTAYECHYLKNNIDIRGQIFCEGNTTVDILHDFADQFFTPCISGDYIYVTMHRKEFTDSRKRMQTVFSILRLMAQRYCKVIFPIHPRTEDAMRRFDICRKSLWPVVTSDPVTAFESFALINHAKAVLTDSGCLQEEAYILKTPCVTIRENTERHLTVINGANIVTGFAPESIEGAIEWALGDPPLSWPNIYGVIGVGRRIVKRVLGTEIGEYCSDQR
jgi:UDP-N-acetylglucosamine 2-epimerase (non-hydrolysing)